MIAAYFNERWLDRRLEGSLKTTSTSL